VLPTPHLRSMEVLANDIFNGYREMYYEGGASSVYFWDLDDNAFAACVLFKKGAPLAYPRLASPPPPPPPPPPRSLPPRPLPHMPACTHWWRCDSACTPGRRRGDED
jgi:hypothetical protein